MAKKLSLGFTLIELMVVIAIMGVLSAVVFGSLNSARDKGYNATIKSSLSNARAQAELYFDANNNDYGGLCGVVAVNGVSTIREQVLAAHNASGAPVGNISYNLLNQQSGPPGGNYPYSNCHAQAADWAVSIPLKVPEVVNGSTKYYWCIDGRGASSGKATPLGGNYICPST